MENSDNPGQVMVLSPNLLQKLGIDLTKFLHNQESVTPIVDTHYNDSIVRKGKTVFAEDKEKPSSDPRNVQSHASMLETANLMKDSLLLNPTFITNNFHASDKESLITNQDRRFSLPEKCENVVTNLTNKPVNSINVNTLNLNQPFDNVIPHCNEDHKKLQSTSRNFEEIKLQSSTRKIIKTNFRNDNKSVNVYLSDCNEGLCKEAENSNITYPVESDTSHDDASEHKLETVVKKDIKISFQEPVNFHQDATMIEKVYLTSDYGLISKTCNNNTTNNVLTSSVEATPALCQNPEKNLNNLLNIDLLDPDKVLNNQEVGSLIYEVKKHVDEDNITNLSFPSNTIINAKVCKKSEKSTMQIMQTSTSNFMDNLIPDDINLFNSALDLSKPTAIVKMEPGKRQTDQSVNKCKVNVISNEIIDLRHYPKSSMKDKANFSSEKNIMISSPMNSLIKVKTNNNKQNETNSLDMNSKLINEQPFLNIDIHKKENEMTNKDTPVALPDINQIFEAIDRYKTPNIRFRYKNNDCLLQESLVHGNVKNNLHNNLQCNQPTTDSVNAECVTHSSRDSSHDVYSNYNKTTYKHMLNDYFVNGIHAKKSNKEHLDILLEEQAHTEHNASEINDILIKNNIIVVEGNNNAMPQDIFQVFSQFNNSSVCIDKTINSAIIEKRLDDLDGFIDSHGDCCTQQSEECTTFDIVSIGSTVSNEDTNESEYVFDHKDNFVNDHHDNTTCSNSINQNHFAINENVLNLIKSSDCNDIPNVNKEIVTNEGTLCDNNYISNKNRLDRDLTSAYCSKHERFFLNIGNDKKKILNDCSRKCSENITQECFDININENNVISVTKLNKCPISKITAADKSIVIDVPDTHIEDTTSDYKVYFENGDEKGIGDILEEEQGSQEIFINDIKTNVMKINVEDIEYQKCLDKSDNIVEKPILNSNKNRHRVNQKSYVKVYPMSKSKHNATQSKLCIQGVEKPGGSTSNNEGCNDINLAFKISNKLKTYIPHRKQNKNSKITNTIYEIPQFCSNNEMEINLKVREKITPKPSFCNCFDFGCPYNTKDFDINYEHVHFINHVPIKCTIEDIFVDRYNTFFEQVEFVQSPYVAAETHEDTDENNAFTTSLHILCWKSFNNNKCISKRTLQNEIKPSNCSVEDIPLDEVESHKHVPLSPNENVEPVVSTVNKDICNLECVNKEVNEEITVEHSGTDSLDKQKNITQNKMFIIKDSDGIIINNETVCIVEVKNHGNEHDRDSTKSICSDVPLANLGNANVNTGLVQVENEKNSNREITIDVKEREHGKKRDRESTESTNSDVPLAKLQKIDTESVTVGNLKILNETDVHDTLSGNKVNKIDSSNVVSSGNKNISKCGVCSKNIESSKWIKHIQTEHNYIAWKEGNTPIDMNSTEAIKNHLKRLSKHLVRFVCAKCGTNKKYGKAYLRHLKLCGVTEDVTLNDTADRSPEVSKMEQGEDEHVTCGVCNVNMKTGDWIDHIQKEHNYLAWKDNEKPLDMNSKEAIKNHLKRLSKHLVQFVCAKCGTNKKYGKSYLQHLKLCGVSKDVTLNDTADGSSEVSKMEQGEDEMVTCGVCNANVNTGDWIDHIQKEHNYLAWKANEKPLDVNNTEEIIFHFQRLSKHIDRFVCANCGLKKKYPKAHLEHVRTCGVIEDVGAHDSTLNDTVEASPVVSRMETDEDNQKVAICAVCNMVIESGNWIAHIQKEHNYLAWKDSEEPLNIDNEKEIQRHLQNICKQNGGLICVKCGYFRKNVKTFLRHTEKCNPQKQLKKKVVGAFASDSNASLGEKIKLENYCCGVCGEQVECKKWFKHIGQDHHYIAWKNGDPPLDLNNEEVVKDHLMNVSKLLGGLLCSKCGIVRKYVKIYLQHVKTCGVTENIAANDNTEEESKMEIEEHDMKVTCAVCSVELEPATWIEHIQKEHNYMAWKVGNEALNVDDTTSVKYHLQDIARQTGGLICAKCGTKKRQVSQYLRHLELCNVQKVVAEPRNSCTCGVCSEKVQECMWYEHIQDKHDYLAWKSGEEPLNVDDIEAVHQHLTNVYSLIGKLICSKCGLTRKYVNKYLQHIKNCGVNPQKEEVSKQVNCAVCNVTVESLDWIEHIQKEHNYLAWKVGEKAFDLNDENEVKNHLYTIIEQIGGLICKGCGYRRRTEDGFYRHILTCRPAQQNPTDNETSHTNYKENDVVTCAVCSTKVKYSKWEDHSMEKHYNLAWIKGNVPIDLKNPPEVERYLKAYKNIMLKLVCKECKTTRASHLGFYAHILTCNKTEEQIEPFKEECPICCSKYLCIYRAQHMRGHEQQRAVVENRLLRQADRENKTSPLIEACTSTPRKAALRARDIIDRYKSIGNEDKYSCSNCNFSTDIEMKFKNHSCDAPCNYNSEIKLSESSSDSMYDDDLCDSDEDKKPRIIHERKSTDMPAKTFPFVVKSLQSFLAQSFNDFCTANFAQKNLYPQWAHCEYESLNEEQVSSYMPLLEESCQVLINNGEWKKYQLFEARYSKSIYSVFVGGTPQSIAWAPPCDYQQQCCHNEYLAVACHRQSLVPTLCHDELYQGPSVIQLWNFNNFSPKKLPRLEILMAHWYGTVWGLAWCPSGTRTCLPTELPCPSSTRSCLPAARLGLLAAACSDGAVHVLSVPNPDALPQSEVKYCKIKPVAELRLCMSEERKKYQATSVCWSTESGHSIILVGYSCGTLAWFDLNIDSPILRTEENGVTVFYPYHDEKPFSTPIKDVGMRGGGDGAVVGVAAGSGAALRCGAGVAPLVAVREQSCVSGGELAPHWPSLMLTNDDPTVTQRVRELSLRGEGRRVGAGAVLRGCACCGDVAATAPPLLRIMRAPHPSRAELKQRVVAIIKMTPLSQKAHKKNVDDLAVKIEPSTYEKAVKKYGLEITVVDTDKKAKNTMPCPPTMSRFPLCDVVQLAYCPARAHHHLLAAATRAGLLLVLPAAFYRYTHRPA